MTELTDRSFLTTVFAMPTAFISQPGLLVSARGRTLLVQDGQACLARIKLIDLDRLVLAGGVNITTPALRRLSAAGIPTALVTQQGRLVGSLLPCGALHWQKLERQFAVCRNPDQRLKLSRQMVLAKLTSMGQLLRRFLSNHPHPAIADAAQQLDETMAPVRAAAHINQLRGLEGRAAAVYWSAFRQTLDQWATWSQRTKRPPRDPLSAALGYGYALLASEVTDLVATLGYEPARGFYHEPRPGRPSLALDMMEPFRHEIVDRLLQRLVNLRQLEPADFRPGPNNAVWLKTEAAKKVVGCYEQLMEGKFERAPGYCPRALLRERVAAQLEAAFGDHPSPPVTFHVPTTVNDLSYGVSA